MTETLAKVPCRVATPADVSAIAALTLELGYQTTVMETGVCLAALLASQDHAIFVAEWQGRVAAWLVVEQRLTLETGVKAEITGLVVGNHARRQGLGEALVAQAETWARQRGLERLLVRSDIRREASHRFYRAIGFEANKTSHVYLKPL